MFNKSFLYLGIIVILISMIVSSCSSGKSGSSAPTARLISPGNGDNNVVLNPKIIVGFNSPVTGVDPSSVELSSGFISSVQLASIKPMSGNIYKITLSNNLAPNTTYILELTSGIKSTSGVSLSKTEFQFTTGNWTAPTIAMISPADGATDISANTQIMFMFSEQVTGVDSTSVILHQGEPDGTTLSTTVTSIDMTTSTLVPTSPLQQATTYYITFLSAIEGVSGVPMAPITFSFTTQAPLSVQMLRPYPTSNVPTNTNIILQFNRPVNGINTASIIVHSGSATGSSVNIDILPSMDGISYTIVPPILSNNTTYYVELVGGQIYDGAGNYLPDTVVSFSTLTTSKPVAKLLSPGQGGASINSILQLQFSEPVTGVNETSVTLSPATGLSFTTKDQALWTITPQGQLQTATTYLLSISGGLIQDSGGNTADAASFTFTTTNTNGPTVWMVQPTDGAQDVPIAQSWGNLIFQFNEPVTGVNNSILLHESSTGNIVPLIPSSGGNSSYYPYQWYAAPYGVKPSTTYYVTLDEAALNITDINNIPLQSVTFSFTTEPLPAATLQSPYPVNVPLNTLTIVLHFNKPVTGVNIGSVEIYPQTTFTIPASTDEQTYNLQFYNTLKADTTYTIILTNSIKDSEGNAVNDESLSFTTVSRPVITGLFPSTTDILPYDQNGQITLTFNEPVSIPDNAVTFMSGSTSMPITVLPSTDGGITYQIELSSLSTNAIYTLYLSNAIVSNSGLTLTPVNYTYSTASGQSTDKPLVRLVQPSQITDVPLDSPIEVQFSEPVQNVNGNMMLNGNVVSVVQTGNTTSYLLNPAPALSPDTTYTLALNSGITAQTSGNSINNTLFTFTTIQDQVGVSMQNPYPGATDVSFKPTIDLSFSPSASGVSTNNVTLHQGTVKGQGITLTGSGSAYIPSVSLLPLTNYFLVVSGQVRCSTGTCTLDTTTFQFTTGPVLPMPAVSLITPAALSNFARETNSPTITLQFNMRVAVPDGSITLTPITGGTSMPISITTINNMIYNITVLGSELPTMTTYNLSLSSEITSQNGGVPLAPTNYTLTTRPLSWAYMGGDESWRRYGYFGTQGERSVQNWPSGRVGAAYWTDSQGNLWMFGGTIQEANNIHALNDLWRFEPPSSAYPLGVWTWMSGQSDQNPDQKNILNTAIGIFSSTNHPGGRDSYAFWITHNPDILWLFGGEYGNNEMSQDLWAYSISTGTWACMGGCDWTTDVTSYGAQGVISTSNWPPARYGEIFWTDSQGNLWMFGGQDQIVEILDDVWRYEPPSISYPNGVWTWMAGKQVNSTDWYIENVYGQKGVTSPSNLCGSREEMMSWQDNSGNVWIFGGYGPDGWTLFDNDLWRYEYNVNLWTWIAGDQNPNNSSFPLGTEDGTPFTVNGDNNDLWLYGGQQAISQSGYANQFLTNDILKYNLTMNTWAMVRNCAVNTSTMVPDPSMKDIFDPTLCPLTGSGYQVSFTDSIGNFWVMTNSAENKDSAGNSYSGILYKFETK